MSDIPEEAIDVATNVVNDQAQQLEDALRSLKKVKFAYAAFGVAMGATAGAFITYKLAWAKAQVAADERADEEIARMAEHYHSKIVAAEEQATKLQPVKDIVAERGYAQPPEPEAEVEAPMAVTPPEAVVEAAKEDIKASQPPEATVVKEPQEHAETRNVFKDHGDPDVDRSWNYSEERAKRSPDHPYIIHEDERAEFEDYQEVTITYYSADDVLCNERDEIIGHEERDSLIGEDTLNKFGHGSSDPDIVYVRNDPLEIVYEIVQSPNSYAEEVHGFTHENHDRRNLQRMRERERDLDDD